MTTPLAGPATEALAAAVAEHTLLPADRFTVTMLDGELHTQDCSVVLRTGAAPTDHLGAHQLLTSYGSFHSCVDALELDGHPLAEWFEEARRHLEVASVLDPHATTVEEVLSIRRDRWMRVFSTVPHAAALETAFDPWHEELFDVLVGAIEGEAQLLRADLPALIRAVGEELAGAVVDPAQYSAHLQPLVNEVLASSSAALDPTERVLVRFGSSGGSALSDAVLNAWAVGRSGLLLLPALPAILLLERTGGVRETHVLEEPLDEGALEALSVLEGDGSILPLEELVAISRAL